MENLITYAIYFCIYAYLGWCLEVAFHVVTMGKFVNRGFLHGPTCPIYGFGCCFIIFLLTPVADNLFLLFLGSIIVTSAIEFVGGFILEKSFHTRWWDYSDEPLNIHGYICARFSLFWGIGALILMDRIHPFIAKIVSLVPYKLTIIILCVHILYYLIDFIASVNKANQFVKNLDQLSRVSNQLTALSYEIGGEITETTLKLIEINQEVKEKLEQTKEKAEKVQVEINEMKQRQRQLEEEAERIMTIVNSSRYIKAFPTMQSNNHQTLLERIKEYRK